MTTRMHIDFQHGSATVELDHGDAIRWHVAQFANNSEVVGVRCESGTNCTVFSGIHGLYATLRVAAGESCRSGPQENQFLNPYLHT